MYTWPAYPSWIDMMHILALGTAPMICNSASIQYCTNTSRIQVLHIIFTKSIISYSYFSFLIFPYEKMLERNVNNVDVLNFQKCRVVFWSSYPSPYLAILQTILQYSTSCKERMSIIDASPRVRAHVEVPEHNTGAEARARRHFNTSPQRLQHEDASLRGKKPMINFISIISSKTFISTM